MHDTDAIRERVSLIELMQRDGIVLRRSGATWKCRCPFHEEKSASCIVKDKGSYQDTFKCFGCGAGGDVFRYYMLSRGVEFVEAAEALARIAGTGVLPDGARFVPKVRAPVAEDGPPPELSGADLRRWTEGVAYLLGSEEEQEKLAQWRGYTRETVRTLAKRGAIGMPLAFGVRRYAFPIEALRQNEGVASDTDALQRYQAGYHVRLPDREKEGKWYFNYTPTGVGAWPYVLGEPRTAKAVIIGEGQWDMIACADALGMLGERDVAFIAVRGSSTWRRVLPWTWPSEAQVWLFVDSDESGRRWLERGADDEPGFAEVVRGRSRALHCYEFDGVKDFNDAHRAEGTQSREAWRELFRADFKRGLKTRRKKA